MRASACRKGSAGRVSVGRTSRKEPTDVAELHVTGAGPYFRASSTRVKRARRAGARARARAFGKRDDT
jgi:hypothetical protein